MACNSIAFSAATVDLSQAVANLEAGLVVEVIKAHLASMGLSVVDVTGLGTLTRIQYNNPTRGAYGAWGTVDINTATGGLSVRAYSGPSQGEVAAQLESVVKGVAALVAQEKVAQQVAALGWVESDFTSQDGTRVITLNI